MSVICTFHRSFGVGSSRVAWVWKCYASDIFGWVACMYVTKEKSIGVWIQLLCISCLHVSLIGQIEKGGSTVDKMNSILLGLFFSIGIQISFLFVSFFFFLFLACFFQSPKSRTHELIRIFSLRITLRVLHLTCKITEGLYSMTSRSNGYYKGSVPSKNSLCDDNYSKNK
jgi:hypothetical protein